MGVVRQLESEGEAEIASSRIGELIMQGLKALDDVAYVRFASVYRDFREARDFGAIIDELQGGDTGETDGGAAKPQRAPKAPA